VDEKQSIPPCSKSAVGLLANNESVVTWLSPKNDMHNYHTHIPVILFKEKYWTLSLRMSKCIYRHICLRKGFNNIQNVHGVQTLRIPQLLLNEKKRTQARFEVFLPVLCGVLAPPAREGATPRATYSDIVFLRLETYESNFICPCRCQCRKCMV